jgi:hypothetical protein
MLLIGCNSVSGCPNSGGGNGNGGGYGNDPCSGGFDFGFGIGLGDPTLLGGCDDPNAGIGFAGSQFAGVHLGPTGLDSNVIAGVKDVLVSSGDCAKFFDSAKIDALTRFDNTDFVTVNGPDRVTWALVNSKPTQVPPYAWDAQVQPGVGRFVQLNRNRGFYQQTTRNVLAGGGYGSNLSTGTIKAGDFIGGSLEYQITTVLHELGHLVDLLPSDKSGGPEASNANTNLILSKCKDAIAQAAKSVLSIP